MQLERAKGTRDFKPEEKIVRQDVIDSLRTIFELYGFNPLETPIIERLEVLSAKYAGGAEILKETFKFKDQGDRELGLRYDLTVPFCRFVGMNPTMKMPFKRYQIGEVFRDGPIKTGRMREFWQCDVDTVGVTSMTADAEFIKIAQDAFKKLKLDVVIEVNNRKLLNGVLESLDIPEDKRIDVILAIDKLQKVEIKEIEKELGQKGVNGRNVDDLLKIFNTKGTNLDKLDKLKKIVKSQIGMEGLKEMEELLSYVDDKNVVFSVSLARGLAYYTGTVFEVFLKDKTITSSLAGGGRYDKMIGDYLGGGREFPAVGISFGIEPITEVLRLGKENLRKTVTQLYVIPIKTLRQSIEIVDKLRKEGVKVDMDLQEKGISKNLDYANSFEIPYVLFVGEKELKQKKVKLRDMKSGKEKMVSVEAVGKEVL